MKEKNRLVQFAKKHRTGIFAIIMTIVMLVGLSYAWLQITLKGEKESTVIAGTLELKLDDAMAEGITVIDAVPIRDEEGLTSAAYTFTLENIGTMDSSYEIYLDDLELPEGKERMQDSFIKYQLIKGTEVIGYDLLNTTGEHPNRLFDKGEISPREKYTYSLRMWIDQNATNEVMETMFRGQLRVEAIQTESKGLYKKIASQAVPDNEKSEFVESSTGISFAQVSSDTNGKGIYMLASSKDDKYPIYYYRGAVNDNNVKFAGFCWKMMRTTETGGIKLVYNGLSDNEGKCTNTTGIATTIGKIRFNDSYDSLADVGYMYGTRYISSAKTIPKVDENWIFGNDITWDGTKYTLKDTVEITASNWERSFGSMFTKHYTCFSTENSCTKVNYIYSLNRADPNPVYYIELANGKTIETAKQEMFSNTNDSIMKKELEKWYRENLLDYTEKLEDTVWCNDRSIASGALKSKDETMLYDCSTTVFQSLANLNMGKTPNLECSREMDRFTVDIKNGNGALTYPVALLTTEEAVLAGAKGGVYNQSYYLYNERSNWLLSPNNITYQIASLYYLDAVGLIQAMATSAELFVRPAVSLKSNTKFESGNGTSTNPYIIN